MNVYLIASGTTEDLNLLKSRSLDLPSLLNFEFVQEAYYEGDTYFDEQQIYSVDGELTCGALAKFMAHSHLRLALHDFTNSLTNRRRSLPAFRATSRTQLNPLLGAPL